MCVHMRDCVLDSRVVCRRSMLRVAMATVDLSLDYCCQEWYVAGERCSGWLADAVGELLEVCLDLWRSAEEKVGWCGVLLCVVQSQS